MAIKKHMDEKEEFHIISLHEAAHAIHAFLAGDRIIKVEINENGGVTSSLNPIFGKIFQKKIFWKSDNLNAF